MNIETAKLPQLSLDLVAHLEEKLYSVSMLNQYRSTYNRFFNYLNENKLAHFSKEMGFSFVDGHYVSEEKSVSRVYRIDMRRRISVLFEFCTEGAVITRKFGKEPQQLSYFGDLFSQYVTNQTERSLGERTLKAKSILIKQFLLYLEDQKISSLWDVRVDDVYKYLLTKGKHAISTRESILYALRDALRFFAASGICKNELGGLFPHISTHADRPVPTCFSADELRIITSAVDRKSSIGKRDYAIILLAAFLGMRAGDISHLRFSSIKWASESIEFTQSKTSHYLQLPLLPELKFALLDYLKNARPKSESDFVFVKHRAPYTSFCESNCFHHVLKKYLSDVDLKGRKHGLHSLRFSVAGNMLLNGTPITTICNVLGHTYSDTTKRYLKIDIDNLRKAALEVE
jgi:site-specific recombinase XerD